jgi:hypothetical protein
MRHTAQTKIVSKTATYDTIKLLFRQNNVLKIGCHQLLSWLLQSNLPDAPENGSKQLFISFVVTYSIPK